MTKRFKPIHLHDHQPDAPSGLCESSKGRVVSSRRRIRSRAFRHEEPTLPLTNRTLGTMFSLRPKKGHNGLYNNSRLRKGRDED